MGRLVRSSVFPHSLVSREQSRCLGGPMGQGVMGASWNPSLRTAGRGSGSWSDLAMEARKHTGGLPGGGGLRERRKPFSPSGQIQWPVFCLCDVGLR